MKRNTMVVAFSILTVAGVLSATAPLAFADETVTTTTKKTEEKAPGVVVGVPGVAVEVGKDDDCKTRSVTKENENTGNTVTRTQTRCN